MEKVSRQLEIFLGSVSFGKNFGRIFWGWVNTKLFNLAQTQDVNIKLPAFFQLSIVFKDQTTIVITAKHGSSNGRAGDS